MAASQKLGGCAIMIQKIYRAMLAKGRMVSKKALDRAANKALESVDARNLFVSDVKELA
jgi:hypothetical protein